MKQDKTLIGRKIIRLFEVGSTNESVRQLVENDSKPGNGSLFITDYQSNGLGLGDNRWESDPGKNLTFSIFLQPDFLKAGRQFMLNIAVSLGLFDFVSRVVPAEKVSIKWPNDIYINFDKVAGILIQHAVSGNEIMYSIAGIGLNVNQKSFSKSIPNPVSLISYTRHELVLEHSLHQLCEHLNKRYQDLKDGNENSLKKDYLNALFGFMEWRDYKYLGKMIGARITGIDRFGRLQLETTEKDLITSDLKEIEYMI